MSSITQNLKIEAIKLFNDTFFEVSKKILSNPIDDFFNKISPLSYIKGMLNFKENLNQVIVETFKLAIPKIDAYFLTSEYRRKNFYKCDTHSRNITLIFGELEFERIYYTDKNKKNGFYFIDQLFGFEKYTTYDPIVRSILIDSSVSINANYSSVKTSFLLGDYSSYLNKNHFKNIPRQTIYNWIKNWNIPKVEYEYFENNKRLYVMVDEKWIHEQIRLSLLDEEERKKHHYIMGKCFVTFTGAKTKNKRTSLLNRHVFMTTSNKPWKSFIEDIYNIYNFEEIEEIYLLSDSGSWILAGKNELKLFKNNNVIVNTCEFHVKQYINRMTKSKEKRKELISIIYEKKDKESFIQLSDEIIENAKNKERKTQYKNYILNHWKTILNMCDREVKSSMESHISHCMAASFGSRPKGYSRKRIEDYVKLQEYKVNGINIMDLYLQSYNKTNDDNFVYNKDNISFSIFEHDSTNLPHKYSSGGLSHLLRNLSLGC